MLLEKTNIMTFTQHYRILLIYVGFILISFLLVDAIDGNSNSRTPCSISQELEALANCRNRKLLNIPPPINNIKFLDLSHNQIHLLKGNAFAGWPLFLEEIYLADNNISKIEYSAFTYLKNLKILDLSQNQLTHFHVDMPIALQILYLDQNPLSGAGNRDPNIFQQRLSFLKYLSLAGTKVRKSAVFSNFLQSLKYLDLQNISSLTLNAEDDLKKLDHLNIIYLTPERMFTGADKHQKCKQLMDSAKKHQTEVKAAPCLPQETFDSKVKSFERAYQVEEAIYGDRVDSVLQDSDLNQDGHENICIYNLQNLVSKGLTNFIKSVLVERRIQSPLYRKIKNLPITLDNYSKAPHLALSDVFVSNFPAFNTSNTVIKPALDIVTMAGADDHKRFRVSYTSTEDNFNMVVNGKYNFYGATGNFSCTFSKVAYETTRHMVRRYDFLVWPTNVLEKISYDKMNCQTSDGQSSSGSAKTANRHVDSVIECVLSAFSNVWMNSLCRLADETSVVPKILEISSKMTNEYRSTVLSRVIGKAISFLKQVSIDSFDVTPFQMENSPVSDDSSQLTIYNVKINNLFEYAAKDQPLSYEVQEEDRPSGIRVTNVIGTYNLICDNKNSSNGKMEPAVLSISTKDNPKDVMNVTISSIQFKVVFEVLTVNRVHKLHVANVTADVNEKNRGTFIFILLQKYLGLEMANEFKRTLTFLIDNVDFYSLNIL